MQIVVPDTTLNPHARAFDEVARTLVGGLSRLGIACNVLAKPALTGEQMLVLAPHLHAPSTLAELPRDTILYTWEPIGAAGSQLMTDSLRSLMTEFVLWDYSEKNLRQWRASGAHRVVHVPLGYDPALLGLAPALPEPDVDVLFYGSTNERRLRVLQAVQERGFTVGTVFGAYGLQRDAAIARSRLVLNLHFYESGILEIARLSYLWANAKPVVCEINAETEVPFGLRDHVLSAPYDELADTVERALADPAALQARAETTRDVFIQAADAAAVLSEALARTARYTHHAEAA